MTLSAYYGMTLFARAIIEFLLLAAPGVDEDSSEGLIASL